MLFRSRLTKLPGYESAIKVIGNAMENDENIKRKVDYLLKTLSV